MVSLRDYLLAVHELEMKIHTEESIITNWKKFRNDIQGKYDTKTQALQNDLSELRKTHKECKTELYELETGSKNKTIKPKDSISDIIVTTIVVGLVVFGIALLISLMFDSSIPYYIAAGVQYRRQPVRLQ